MSGGESVVVAVSGRSGDRSRDAELAPASGRLPGMFEGVRGLATHATTADERGPSERTGGFGAEAASGDFAGSCGDAAAIRGLASTVGKYVERIHGAGDRGTGVRRADFRPGGGDPGDSGAVAGEQH